MSYEINGLRNIVSQTSHLGGMAAPPEPSEFATDAEYQDAYDCWYADMHYWRATRVERP